MAGRPRTNHGRTCGAKNRRGLPCQCKLLFQGALQVPRWPIHRTENRNRQLKAGRKLVTLYLTPEASSRLRKLARNCTTGEIVERAIHDLWAAYSGKDAKSERGD